MAKFRTKFWELLSEKELTEGKRYNNMSEVAERVGVSRMTLYKYADETMPSVDAKTVNAFLAFFGLRQDEIDRFLVLNDNPQLDAQEGRSNGARTLGITALAG